MIVQRASLVITVASLVLLLTTNVTSSPTECRDQTAYYASILSKFTSSSGATLKRTISTRISSPARRLPYTSSAYDTWDAIETLDAANSNQIREIYTRDTSDKTDHADWNREHLWPQSRGVGDDSYAVVDIHALRAADMNVNSARGNLFFGNCPGCAVGHSEAPLSKKDSVKFEPPAEVKGDIARAIFFMATRYMGTLTLTDRPVQANDMGYLSDLIQWHIDDPVSTAERTRNNKACEIQYNRNPFIDYPCLVGQVFGGNAPGCTSTGGGGGNTNSDSPIIAQYLEGSSNNKALQIMNPSKTAIDLSSYSIRMFFNGDTSSSRNINYGSLVLQPGARYTICHSALSSSSICDQSSSSLIFNGNDVVALYNGNSVVDAIGTLGESVSGGWDVCNYAAATKDQTLLRSSSVSSGNGGDWSTARRCDEWVVNPINSWNALIARSNSNNDELIVVSSDDTTSSPLIIGLGVGVGFAVLATVGVLIRYKRGDSLPALRQKSTSITLFSSSRENDMFEDFRVGDKV